MRQKIKNHFKNNWMFYGYGGCIAMNIPIVWSCGLCIHTIAWIAIGFNLGCLLWHKSFVRATRWRDEAIARGYDRYEKSRIENIQLKIEIQKLKDGKNS